MSMHDSEFSIENWLLYRLWNVSQEAGFLLEQFYSKQFGLDGEGWRSIAALATYAPISAKQLAAILDLNAVQMTRALTKLQNLGLVSRRTDQRDKRRIVLRLTAKGTDVFQQIIPKALSVEGELMSGFSAAEREQLTGFLKRMEENVAAGLTEESSRLK